jgi:hypothetical protein
VAEYAACISDEVAALIQIVNGLVSCAMVTRAESAAYFDIVAAPLPASCMSLIDNCPELYPPSPLTIP